MEWYERTVRLRSVGWPMIGGGTRGKVKGLSASSAGRLEHVVENEEWEAFVGLSYPVVFPHEGAVVKHHINRFVIELGRITCGTVKVVWVLEFQSRGAPHFHLLTSVWVPKEWLARTWHGIAGAGDPKHLKSGTSVGSARDTPERNLRAYFIKRYVSKGGDQKRVPEGFADVGRMWGCSRGLAKARGSCRLRESEGVEAKRLMARYVTAERRRRNRRYRRRRRRYESKRMGLSTRTGGERLACGILRQVAYGGASSESVRGD